MLELAMTSARGNQVPAIVREQPKDLANLHAQDYAPAAPRLSTCGLMCKLNVTDGQSEASPFGVRSNAGLRRV